jgi:type VI secretion system protein ImpC
MTTSAEPLTQAGADPALAAWHEAAAALLRAPLPPAVHDAISVAATESRTTGSVDLAVERVIAALDATIHACLDEVLHHPGFQRLEAAWRGLEYVVDLVSLYENVKVSVWNWTKADIAHDFEESTEPTKTRTFLEMYTAEYGVFGGEPYAAILADMEFGADAADVALLRRIAGLAAMAHAPFFASASPRLLQLRSWRDLPTVTEVQGIFEAPGFIGWNALRDEPDARYVGLLLPRCLIRLPYTPFGEETTTGYTETIGHEGTGLLWGSPTFPFAVRLAATFARYGTLTALVGDDADAPPAPARATFAALGAAYSRPPVEVAVSARLERALREAGLITLLHRKGTTRVWIASANSLQVPRRFGGSEGGRDATLNYLLGTQFPYLLLASRIAHYLKVIERDMLGSVRTPIELERELDGWLSGLVNSMDAMSPEERAQYPLRHAEVGVTPDPASAGWLHAELKIRPHLRYLGSVFTLSLSSWLERRGT